MLWCVARATLPHQGALARVVAEELGLPREPGLRGTEGTMIAGRVIMLSRDQGLASIAGKFVGHGRPLTRFSSPTDVPDWLRPPTGAVVLDYPKAARVIVYSQLRQRYLGPVLAVLEPDEESSGLPTDHGRIVTLHRPFTGEELSASLDALAGSRNGARGPKSCELTAPPLGADAAATAPLDVSAVFAPTPASLRARLVAGGSGAMTPAVAARAWMPTTAPARADIAPAVVGVPATRIAGRQVAVARRRHGLAWRRMGPTSRRRVNSLVLTLAASAALVLGAALGDGGHRAGEPGPGEPAARRAGGDRVGQRRRHQGPGRSQGRRPVARPEHGHPDRLWRERSDQRNLVVQRRRSVADGRARACRGRLRDGWLRRRLRGRRVQRWRRALADHAPDHHDLAGDHHRASAHHHPTDDGAARYPAADDQPAANRSAHHKPAADRPADHPPPHHRAADHRAADDRAAHDRGRLVGLGRRPPRPASPGPAYSSMLDITCCSGAIAPANDMPSDLRR